MNAGAAVLSGNRQGGTPTPESPRPARMVSFGRNATIYDDGASAGHWYEVVSGAARTCKLMQDGRRQVIGFHLPGEHFGLGSQDTHDHSAEAAADEPTVVVRHDRRVLERRIRIDPQLACRLCAIAFQELLEAQHRLVLLGRRTAVERIAVFLLEMAERLPRRPEPDGFNLPMSREDIADHLGMTVETVSRILTEFHRSGLIAISSRRLVRILDPAGLAAIDGQPRRTDHGRTRKFQLAVLRAAA